MQLKPDVLAAIFRHLFDKPNFSTVLCEALRSSVIGEDFLGDFCNVLQFSVSEKIGLALALADSENIDVRTSGELFEGSLIDCFWPFDSFAFSSNILMSFWDLWNV